MSEDNTQDPQMDLPIVTLVGDNGEEFPMLFIDQVELNDKTYVLLAPPDDEETAEDESNQVVLMRLDGDSLLTIDDEDEFNAVTDAIQAMLFGQA